MVPQKLPQVNMEKLKLIKRTNPDPLNIFDDSLIKIRGYEDIYAQTSFKTDESALLITTRASGEFKNHGFYLSPEADWHLGIDSEDKIVLVPTKKR